MTKRTYYNDSYTIEFSAEITEQTFFNEQPAVVLATSYFYPESGGQPHDIGTIGPATVNNVQIRPADEAVLHILDQPLATGTYPATIDWQRRFDLMQQHSGQHILSRAFVNIAEAETVSFHVGDAHCTIDLDVEKLDEQTLRRVEALANQIVWENRPISAQFLSKTDALKLSLRKVPDVPGDELRVVTIEDYDWNACGGTHVANTGEVGLIKITKLERIRKQLRVEFRCGRRAVTHYAQQHAIVSQLASDLTCAPTDLTHNISNLRSDLKQSHKMIKKQQNELTQFEAQALAESAESIASVNLICQVLSNRDMGTLRQMAQVLTRQDNFAVLLASGESIVGARSENVSAEINTLLKPILETYSGKGGGSAQIAQATQLGVNSAELQAILGKIKAELVAVLRSCDVSE